MRTTRFIQALLASFALSACASGSALDLPARSAAPGTWTTRNVYVAPPRVAAPVVDTTAQRESLRSVPHAADRYKSGAYK